MRVELLQHFVSGVSFALIGGLLVWRMFWKNPRPARVAFACPLCATHYALPGATLTHRRARVRCSRCRGVFEVLDGEEVRVLHPP